MSYGLQVLTSSGEKNTFEIETETVVAGFKFSSMTIIAKRSGAPESKPATKILPIEGGFEMRQTGEGITDVECLLKTAPGGMVFSMGSNTVVELIVEQTQGNEKIAVKSNVSLQNMWTMLSDERNLLHIENAANAPVILMGFQEHSIKIEQDSAAEFGFPFGQARQQIGVGSDGIEGLFLFRQSLEVPADSFYIFADRGMIEVNGEKLPPGASMIFPLDGQQPAKEQEEIFIAPSEPRRERRGRPPREEVGSPTQP